VSYQPFRKPYYHSSFSKNLFSEALLKVMSKNYFLKALETFHKDYS
jgi:hypothetical protein